MTKNNHVCFAILVAPLLMLGPITDRALGQSDGEDALVWSTPSEIFARADTSRRAILVYVNAPSCGPCKRMEREVFPAVRSLLDRLERATLNLDDNESTQALLGQRRTPFEWASFYGIDRTPGWVILSHVGTPVATATGFLDANAFGLLLAYGATGAFNYATFEEYAERVGN